MSEIRFVKADKMKDKPADMSKVKFGTVFTDYMFEMEYDEKNGWHDARITPYKDLAVSPANATLHYGQAVFEGMKAYRYNDGKQAAIFRPMTHLERMENSCKILDIPEFPLETVHEGLKKLIDIEKDWIPDGPGQSLYIRPVIFATDPYLGVSVSSMYTMLIILSPVAAYYANGFAPVKIMVEDKYVRAVRGGLGEAKTPANYAASLHAGMVAHEKGYDQTLWLDGVERKYIEEVGSMNILFKIDGKIVTPMLDGSILNGVTRRTVLAIAKEWGYETEERRISVDELKQYYESGKLEEVFGSGTAAVISPVSTLGYKGHDMTISGGKIGEFAQKMYDEIDGLHTGKVKDTYGFIEIVGEY